MKLILVAHTFSRDLGTVCSSPGSLQPSFLEVVQVQLISFIRTLMSSLAMRNARHFVGHFSNKFCPIANTANANGFGSDSFLIVSKEVVELFLFGG
jgi:hypothetical protein